MPSVYFEDFEILWAKVESKFADENNCPFTLDGLHKHFISQNLINPLTNFASIEEKFLKHIGSTEKPQNVNLSETIFNALYKYVGIRGISELKGNTYIDSDEVIQMIIEESEKADENRFYSREINLAEIGFLGRADELSELENFLQSSESRIFALYGVPMIGKTKLVNHFLENSETAKTYKVISVKLNPKPDNAEQRIKDEVFGDRDFNDFSDFSSNTIIIIQNFEETLKWTGNPRELHDIKDRYANIKTFIEKSAEISSIKLILESRFQIHFEVFLTDWRTKVKTLPDVQLKGIEKNEFRVFYKSKGFTTEQFETLCENFDNHTGLLALAYNDAEFLFQNRLIEAYYQPALTTRFLWDLVEHIINRLENREILILCALTFLQEPVKKENLYEDFLLLREFEDEFQIGESFNSLANKLLVQLERGRYDLNPYIREVCYTFLKVRRRIQMLTIENLPFFKENGKTPFYNEIRQAQEKGDFQVFFRLIKENRQNRNYEETHNYLASALLDPQFKEVIVLNEIAITYKVEKKLGKAIETLEMAREKYPNNVKILNELGICYRESDQLDKAIETLEKTREKYPNDVKILDELAICYREINRIGKAIETLKMAMKIKPDNVQTLNELGICYRENHQFDKAIETLEKAVQLGNIHSYNELAICFLKEGKFQESIETARKAIKLKNYPSYTVLAETYQRLGNLEMAYQTLKEGMNTSGWDKSRLTRKFQELKKLIEEKKKEKRIKKLKVFLSYSHKDADIKEELDIHLSALKRSDKISTWNDSELPAGAEWDKTIKTELENADIVLLLITANFIASPYIWSVEIKKAIEKHENGTAVVIPIFCKFCDFEEMPFAKLNGLPKDAKFISSQPDKDQAYTEVAKGIRKVVESRLS